MPTGAQRFALQQLERSAPTVPDLPLATVTTVTAGASTDDIALVTVNYLGASLKFPYLTSYTPVVGHRVALGRCGGVWTILGRPGGFPPAT
jgi:hypothetical protein